MPTKRSQCQRKNEREPKKQLASLWRRKKITKNTSAGRGQETQCEIPEEAKTCNAIAKFKATVAAIEENTRPKTAKASFPRPFPNILVYAESIWRNCILIL